MSEEQRNSSINKDNREGDSSSAAKTGEKTLSPQVVVSLIVLLLFAVFAAVNTQEVSIGFVVTTVEIPLIIVIVGSFILGGLTTALTGWRSRRRKHKK